MTSANLETDYSAAIGKPVIKEIKQSKKGNWIVPKPFKSKKLINTVKGIIDHPILHIPAYTFEEDDSFVECRRCTVLRNNPTRSRNYGLDLLDTVSYRSWDKNQKPRIGTVLMLGFMDNNRVHVKTEGGIEDWVAEWCERLNYPKVEIVETPVPRFVGKNLIAEFDDSRNRIRVDEMWFDLDTRWTIKNI